MMMVLKSAMMKLKSAMIILTASVKVLVAGLTTKAIKCSFSVTKKFCIKKHPSISIWFKRLSIKLVIIAK